MRTIFFSLSSSGVYRNLFFFPQSVFTQLKECLRGDPDTRVVVIMPLRFREKYLSFIVHKEYLRPWYEVLARLGFPAGARFVLYVSGSAYCPDEPDIIEKILA